MPWQNYIDGVIHQYPGLSDIFIRESFTDGLEVSAMVNGNRLQIDLPEKDSTFELLLAAIFPNGVPTLGLDSLDPAITFGEHRFRVSYGPYHNGREATLRYLENRIRTPAELGIPPAIVSTFLSLQSGLVAVSGEMGAGKSTLVASLILAMGVQSPKRFLTIEDPVELIYPKLGPTQSEFVQREVGTSCRSFAAGLREIRRKHANVIVIGEIRDAETAEGALRASLTGHLVVATIHAADAPGTVEALITELPASRQAWGLSSLSRALRMVVGQRLYESPLTKRLCPVNEVFFNLKHHTAIAATIAKGEFRGIYQCMDSCKREGMMTFRDSLEQRIRAKQLPPELMRDPLYREHA